MLVLERGPEVDAGRAAGLARFRTDAVVVCVWGRGRGRAAGPDELLDEDALG